MKMLLLIMLLVAQDREFYISGTELIFEGGLLPPHELAGENKEYEEEALLLVDSLRSTEKRPFLDSIIVAKGHKPIRFAPKIEERYSFDDFPCLHFYYLSTGSIEFGWDYNRNYNYLFYNNCNSSIYRLGGGLESFNKVFRPLIVAANDSSSLEKLIMLYLNTETYSHIYFEMNSFEDILVHYPDTLLWAGDELNCDRKLINDLLENRPEYYLKDSQEIRLYTWNLSNGDIKYWHFKIQDGKLV
jgi:hypothetical protein